MSLSYACVCKVCEYYTSKERERQYCKECLQRLQIQKREKHFATDYENN